MNVEQIILKQLIDDYFKKRGEQTPSEVYHLALNTMASWEITPKETIKHLIKLYELIEDYFRKRGDKTPSGVYFWAFSTMSAWKITPEETMKHLKQLFDQSTTKEIEAQMQAIQRIIDQTIDQYFEN